MGKVTWAFYLKDRRVSGNNGGNSESKTPAPQPPAERGFCPGPESTQLGARRAQGSPLADWARRGSTAGDRRGERRGESAAASPHSLTHTEGPGVAAEHSALRKQPPADLRAPRRAGTWDT